MDLFWSTRRAVMVHVDYGFLAHKHLFYCTFRVSLGIGIITNRVYHKTQTHFFKKKRARKCV